MHGSSLEAVSLTRAAHPAELSKSAAEVRVPVAGRAPADAEVATATVRTATATGTSHRCGKRRGRRNIRPTPIPDLALLEFGAKRPINHRATRPRALARPPADRRGVRPLGSAVRNLPRPAPETSRASYLSTGPAILPAAEANAAKRAQGAGDPGDLSPGIPWEGPVPTVNATAPVSAQRRQRVHAPASSAEANVLAGEVHQHALAGNADILDGRARRQGG